MDNKHLPPHDHRPPHGKPIPPHGVPPYGTYDMYEPHKHFHGKPDNHFAHFTPHLLHYHIPQSFKFWCNKVIPLVYDDSLSYMELLNKVVMYLNGMLEDEKLVAVNMEELARAYHELEHFVNDYFTFYQSKGIINNDIAVTNKNYLEILPDCDTAQMNTAYRLKFVEGSEQNIPANLPESAIPFSGAECVLLNLSNFILKRMGGEWQEVPPNGKQANLTNNYQMLMTDRDIYFREHNGDEWQAWQSIFGNWWSIEWEKVKKYVDDGDEAVTNAMTELINSVRNELTTLINNVKTELTNALNAEIARATVRENEIAQDLQFEVERAQDAEQEIRDSYIPNEGNTTNDDFSLRRKSVDIRGTNGSVQIVSHNDKIVLNTASDKTAHYVKGNGGSTANNEIATVGDVNSAVEAERTRAVNAEQALNSKIDTETANRINADTQLSNDITAETNRATTKENELSSAISAETTRATTAENTLSNAITTETNRATTAENELSGAITAETTRATTAENSLRTAITNETSRATTAENALSARIQDWETDLADEREDRQQGDLANANAISAETTRATNAESALGDRITAETTRATNAETALGNRVTAVENNKADRSELNGYIPNAGNDTDVVFGLERQSMSFSTTDGTIVFEADDGGELSVSGAVEMRSTDGNIIGVGEFAKMTGYQGAEVEVSDEVNIRGNGDGSVRVADLVALMDDNGNYITIDDDIKVYTNETVSIRANASDASIYGDGGVTIKSGEYATITASNENNASLTGGSATVRSNNGNLTLMQASNAPLSLVTGNGANSKAYYQKGGQHTPVATEEIATVGDVQSATSGLATQTDINNAVAGYIPNAGNTTNDQLNISRQRTKFTSTGSTNGFVVEGGNVDIKATLNSNRTMNLESTGTMTVHSTNSSTSIEGADGVTVESPDTVEINSTAGNVNINAFGDLVLQCADVITLYSGNDCTFNYGTGSNSDVRIEYDVDGVRIEANSGAYIDCGKAIDPEEINIRSGSATLTVGDDTISNSYDSIRAIAHDFTISSPKYTGTIRTGLHIRGDSDSLLSSSTDSHKVTNIPQAYYNTEIDLLGSIQIDDGDSVIFPTNCKVMNDITNAGIISGSSGINPIDSTASIYPNLTLEGVTIDFGTDVPVFGSKYSTGKMTLKNCRIVGDTLFTNPYKGSLIIDGCWINADVKLGGGVVAQISNSYLAGTVELATPAIGAQYKTIISSCKIPNGVTGSGASSAIQINVTT